MSTQYDTLASSYDTWADLPSEILTHRSIPRTLGAVHDLNILDLACGTGYIEKLAMSLGARYVLGIDVSPAMIEVARITTPPSEKIAYHIADLAQPLNLPTSVLPAGGQFDVVTAMWLFPFAPNSASLQVMFHNISSHLKPGGRFVAINPAFNTTAPSYQAKYGMTHEILEEPKEEEDPITVRATVHLSKPVQMVAYHHPKSSYERFAKEAGLEDFRFEAPGWDILEQEDDKEFWKEWMRDPAHLMITAKKKMDH